MICEINSLYLIMQFFGEFLQPPVQPKIHENSFIKDIQLNEQFKILTSPARVSFSNIKKGNLVEQLKKRFKRAPGPPPYPPVYEDYLTEQQKRQQTNEQYESLGYLTNKRMLNMITQVLGAFWGASTIGQYRGGKPLSFKMIPPISWLKNSIRDDLSTTEKTGYRPPQWFD